MTRRLKLSLSVLAAAAFGAVLVAQSLAPQGLDAQEFRRIVRNEAMGMRGVVRGRVITNDGRSPRGLRVNARFTHHKTGAWGEGSALCGSDGRFVIRGLGNDEFFVSADPARGYILPPPARANLRHGGTIALPDLNLTLGPEITVRVRDPLAGKGIPGMKVFVGRFGLGNEAHTTDANGVVRFPYGDLEGELKLDLNSHDYEPAPGSRFVTSFRLDRPRPFEWNVFAYRQGTDPTIRRATFRGQVVDTGGRPVVGATVRLRRGEEKVSTTDSDGRYAIESVRVESVEEDPWWSPGGHGGGVIFIQKGMLRTTRRLRGSDAWTVPWIVLKPARPTSAYGLAVDERGRPLVGCRITMWAAYGSEGTVQPQNGGVSDSKGRFELKDLDPQASYNFSFGGYDERGKLGTTYLPANRHGGFLPFREGERRDFGTIVVPLADLVVAGQLADKTGRPVTTQTAVGVYGDHTQAFGFPDAKGCFRFDGIVDEPLVLRVFASDGHFTRASAKDNPDLLLARPVRAGEIRLRVVVAPRPPLP